MKIPKNKSLPVTGRLQSISDIQNCLQPSVYLECFLTCFVCFFINCMMSTKNNQQLYSTQIFMKETAANGVIGGLKALLQRKNRSDRCCIRLFHPRSPSCQISQYDFECVVLVLIDTTH